MTAQQAQEDLDVMYDYDAYARRYRLMEYRVFGVNIMPDSILIQAFDEGFSPTTIIESEIKNSEKYEED